MVEKEQIGHRAAGGVVGGEGGSHHRGTLDRVRLGGRGMLVVSGGLAATILCLVWGMRAKPGWALDLRVYQAGGAAWARGLPLYVDHFGQPVGGPDLPFTYPPIAAVMFSVLSVVSLPIMIAAVVVLNLAALVTLCLVAATRQYGSGTPDGSGTPALVTGLSVAGVSVLLEPVRETLWSVRSTWCSGCSWPLTACCRGPRGRGAC